MSELIKSEKYTLRHPIGNRKVINHWPYMPWTWGVEATKVVGDLNAEFELNKRLLESSTDLTPDEIDLLSIHDYEFILGFMAGKTGKDEIDPDVVSN